jgi:hypothetical protein
MAFVRGNAAAIAGKSCCLQRGAYEFMAHQPLVYFFLLSLFNEA